MVGQGIEAGDIRAPADGPVSWTARDDLAEADAILLARDDGARGPTPPLTACEAVTLDEVAAMASEVTGRPVRRTVLEDESWVEERIAQGVPAAMARMLLGTFRAARRGDFAATAPTLQALLGRPALTMRDVLERTLRHG